MERESWWIAAVLALVTALVVWIGLTDRLTPVQKAEILGELIEAVGEAAAGLADVEIDIE